MIVSLSILSASLLDLAREIQRMQKAGVDRVHLDVMDGQFVEKIAFGPDWVQAIGHHFPQLPVDAHLMVQSVSAAQYHSYQDAGAQGLWLHATTDLGGIDHATASWVLNLEETEVDLPSEPQKCLLMSVKPGRGGQKFSPTVLEKVRALKQRWPQLWIAVDGGVHEDVIQPLHEAGVDEVILGHALIFHPDPRGLIEYIHQF